ncbi:MAG: hypothetical protein IT258_15325 [Saprospiraceae bacterium]|nr:hypothetical protein [Saprospiraceae bacterium]
MKKREGYDFKLSEDKIRYEFTSTGPKGRIGKAVLFEMIAEEVWNLSFGDLSADGDFDDSIVTDNNDMRIVLQSLANIIHDFFDQHPNCEVFIDPVDNRRKLLYNRIFQEKHVEIQSIFEVSGVLKQPLRREGYSHQITYDCFLVKRK